MALNGDMCQTIFPDVESPIKKSDLTSLRTALDTLNTTKGNVQNCNCSPSNCCQSAVCQSCQSCQTSVCQSCQRCQSCQKSKCTAGFITLNSYSILMEYNNG